MSSYSNLLTAEGDMTSGQTFSERLAWSVVVPFGSAALDTAADLATALAGGCDVLGSGCRPVSVPMLTVMLV